MKRIITLISLVSAGLVAQAQTCSSYLVASVKDTASSTDIVHTSLKYNTAGYPVQRTNYTPGTTTVKFVEKYYYSGTNRLDSIVGFTDATYSTKIAVYRYYTYDANNNMVKEVKMTEGNSSTETTTLTYASNKLTSISSPDYDINNITYNGNNFGTASVSVVFFGNNITGNGNFTFDSKANPFYKKLGITEDLLSYFTQNSLIKFAVTSPVTQDVITVTIKYDANANMPSHLSRLESLNNSTIKSAFTYDCASSLVLNQNDKTIENLTEIAPNPSVDGLFTIGMNIEKATVKTMTGATVLETTSNILNLSNQKSGIYIVEVQTATGIKVAKVVKQ
jgi:hypothetical protein